MLILLIKNNSKASQFISSQIWHVFGGFRKEQIVILVDNVNKFNVNSRQCPIPERGHLQNLVTNFPIWKFSRVVLFCDQLKICQVEKVCF